MEKFKTYLLENGYSESTIKNILNMAWQFETWLEDQKIVHSMVTYNDITSYIGTLKKRGLKQSSIQLIVQTLRNYFGYLRSIDAVTENILLAIKIKGVKKTGLYNTYSTEQLRFLYNDYPSKEHTLFELPLSDTELRNKIVLSLFVFQGISTTDLKRLKVDNVSIRTGMIHLQRTKRINARSLALDSSQVIDMQHYLLSVRKKILDGRESDDLIVGYYGGKGSLHNIINYLLIDLKAIVPDLEGYRHIRTSVITNWLREHNLRKTQYMAGHRFVSSTERYQQNDIDTLLTEFERFAPKL